MREGPWVSLRTPLGVVFFTNLWTGATRWFPPRRWMEAWQSRPREDPDTGCATDVLFDGHRLAQQLLPRPLARQLTEGGAPPLLHERGSPRFAPDAEDTPDTHPLAPALTTCPGE